MTPYYSDDLVTIYHGDCRDVLAQVTDTADLLLTDPPYGMAYEAATGQAMNVAGDGVREGVRVFRQSLFAAMPRMAPDAHALVFCHWQSWPDFHDAVAPLMPLRNALIWHKGGGGMGNVRSNYIRDYEVILYAALGSRPVGGEGKFGSVLLGYPKPSGIGRAHPTQKPTSLLAYLVDRHAPVGGTVLDPFLGSGSTLIAAKSLGRRAIGIEIEERYCEIAAQRCSQEVMGLVS